VAILNYTSKVPVTQTIKEITDILVRHNAKSVMQCFGADRTLKEISFVITVECGDLNFRMPSNVDAVYRIMRQQLPEWRGKTPSPAQEPIWRGQAERTAWRILKDWVEAQMAILDVEMVTMVQVFMPYLVTNDGITLYDKMLAHQFKLREGG